MCHFVLPVPIINNSQPYVVLPRPLRLSRAIVLLINGIFVENFSNSAVGTPVTIPTAAAVVSLLRVSREKWSLPQRQAFDNFHYKQRTTF